MRGRSRGIRISQLCAGPPLCPGRGELSFAAAFVGFGATGLVEDRVAQPGLFVEEADVVREKREKVSRALDAIRGKLDGGAIGFGGATRD